MEKARQQERQQDSATRLLVLDRRSGDR